jgi:hypothetical protein
MSTSPNRKSELIKFQRHWKIKLKRKLMMKRTRSMKTVKRKKMKSMMRILQALEQMKRSIKT